MTNLVKNPNYKITLQVNKGGAVVDTIEGNISENFMMSAGSQWEPLMNSSIRSIIQQYGGKAGQLAGGFAKSSNLDAVIKPLTFHVWQSSSPIEFNLTLLFDAYSDAVTDVVDPMNRLQGLAMPVDAAEQTLLVPPGPSRVKPNENRINIKLGKFIYIHSVIMISCNNTYDTRYDKNGQPISGQSEITLRTIVTPSREDVTKFFMALGNGPDTQFGVGDNFTEVRE